MHLYPGFHKQVQVFQCGYGRINMADFSIDIGRQYIPVKRIVIDMPDHIELFVVHLFKRLNVIHLSVPFPLQLSSPPSDA